MNSQKRRKNRVQGSWASQTKSVREGEFGCDKVKYKSMTMAGENSSPQISDNRTRSYVFEKEIAKVRTVIFKFEFIFKFIARFLFFSFGDD